MVKVYFPVYDRGWHIEEVDADQLYLMTPNRVARHKNNTAYPGFYGTIYDATCCFKTIEAARGYINKEAVPLDQRYTQFKYLGE